MVYLCFRVLQVELDWIFHTVIWFNYLAFAVTYLEQNIRKELFFGKVGSLEGIVFILVIMISCISDNGVVFWHEKYIEFFPNYILIFFCFFAGCLYTFKGSFKRIGFFPKDFIIFSISGSLLYLMCLYYRFNWDLTFLVLTVYSSDYILKLMKTYFFDGSRQTPDSTLYVLLGAMIIFEYISVKAEPLFLIYGIVMLSKLLWQAYIVFSELRTYWVWWNDH